MTDAIPANSQPTSDVSCPRCGTGFWVTSPDAAPWTGCSECEVPECACGEIVWLEGALLIEVDRRTHRLDRCDPASLFEPDVDMRAFSLVFAAAFVLIVAAGIWFGVAR